MTEAQAPAPSSRAWRGPVLERLIVMALPALLTLPRFRNGFVFDDVFVIVRGDFIHTPSRLAESFTRHAMVASSLDAVVGQPSLDTYRPIPLLTFFWDAWLSGRDPWAYHLTNTLLHALVCLGLLSLLRRLVPALPSVTRVALVLVVGLSPWLSEAHVWINGRSDPLMTLFLLGALFGALSRPGPRSRLVVFAGVLLALLSKEVAVLALPFIVLAPCVPSPHEGQPAVALRPWRMRALARAVTPVALALGVYLALRVRALDGLKTHDDTGQLLAALRNLPLLWMDGLYRTLAPSAYGLRNLRDDYAAFGTPALALAILGVALVALGALRARRAAPMLGFGLAWFALTLAPVSLISTGLWPGFGRYLYLPSIGVVLALGGGLAALAEARPGLRRVALGLPALLSLLSAPLLVFATGLYHDEGTLYAEAQERAPGQAWTHGFQGLALRRAGDCRAAIPLLELAARLDPRESRYLVHLGHCLVETRQRDPALEVALRGQRLFAGTRAEAAFLLIHASSLPVGELDDAERLLRRCLVIDPLRSDCTAGLSTIAARRNL